MDIVTIHVNVYQMYDNLFQTLKTVFFDDEQALKNLKIQEVLNSITTKNSEQIRYYFKKGYTPNFLSSNDMQILEEAYENKKQIAVYVYADENNTQLITVLVGENDLVW